MTITLVDVAGANFRTDEGADRLNSEFMSRLGVKARFVPARLAIARSLAAQGSPTQINEGDLGKAIKGDTLFGTGSTLSTWFALVVQKSGGDVENLKDLLAIVGAHWSRGLQLLDTEWRHSEGQEVAFIRRLVDVAGLPAKSGGRTSFGDDAVSIDTGPIHVPIGEVSSDVVAKTPIAWTMNGPGGSPHSAIMGGVGSGKTRTAVAMLKAIRQSSHVPFLAFDFKGDLGTDNEGKGYGLDRVFDAQIIQPPRQPIPLDVLHLDNSDEYQVSESALRFRESFGRLKGSTFGTKQRSAVAEAAETALRSHRPCEIKDIRSALRHIYEDKGLPEDGATAALDDICRFPLFTPAMSPAEFFRQSWIIRLPQEVPEVCRGIVVNLMLDALDSYLNSLPDAPMLDGKHRSLRVLCLIDEAHRILGTKLPSLSNLIRMSRSKGGSVMLISQSPDDFSSEEDEFLSEMGLVAAFATNAKPTAATRIFGKGANLVKLTTGQCITKLRGDDSSRRVIAWNPK